MGKVLIVGDSQSVVPGSIAKSTLQSLGHTVQVVSNTGKGPYDYVRLPALWSQYTSAIQSFKPDIIMLIFGHNDPANDNLRNALRQLKTRVAPKVLLTGPPMYLDPESQAEGLAIQAINREVFGVDYFDAYPHTSLSLPRAAPTATFNPNPHFTPTGARPWGEAIASEIDRRLGGAGLGPH